MNQLEIRSQIVDALSTTLRRSLNLADVPGLLEECLKHDAWREFKTDRGEIVRYGEHEFREFLCAPPLRGLGGSEEGFLAVLRAAGRDDLVARVRDLLTNEPMPAHGEVGNGRPSRVCATKSTSTDATYALRRLKRDAPELAADVVAGVLSASAAAVQAGFRKPYFRVRADDVDRAVAKLIEFYSADELIGALKRRGR